MKIKIELEIQVDNSADLLKEKCVENIQELAIVYKSQARQDPQDFINCWCSPITVKSLTIT